MDNFGHLIVWIAITVIGLNISYSIYEAVKAHLKKKDWQKSAFFGAIQIVGLIAFIIAVYFTFTPGEPTTITPAAEEGYRKQVEAAPDPPTPVELAADIEANRDENLKAQERDFTEEATEADDYIRKTLKNYGDQK